MNRRHLLLSSGASLLAAAVLPRDILADDDVFSFQRQFTMPELDFEHSISYYLSCLLGPDAKTAMIAYDSAEEIFIDSLIEGLEDDGFNVADKEDFDIEIDRFDDEKVKRNGISFAVSSSDSPFDLYVHAITATRKRIVNVWAAVSLNEDPQELIDLAEEFMKFTAIKEASLPNMMPDEDDMDDYELMSEGPIEDADSF